MEVNKSSIVYSLSGSTDEIFPYLDYLLQDLWELGGGTEQILELLERNFGTRLPSLKVLDLCCGKGALLISIADKFKCTGKGIDLFEPFILDALSKCKQYNLEHLLSFDLMDIKDAVETCRNYDIVIYGSDVNILGDEAETLRKISKCCSPKGYIVYETVMKSYENDIKIFDKLGLQIIDSAFFDRNELIEENKLNCEKIRRRVSELIAKYPDRKELFENYIASQEKESSDLENELILVRFLLQCK